MKEVLAILEKEISRQDRKYGPFGPETADMRFGIACLEDEVNETLTVWRMERRNESSGVWPETCYEALQVAAIALRMIRDSGHDARDIYIN